MASTVCSRRRSFYLQITQTEKSNLYMYELQCLIYRYVKTQKHITDTYSNTQYFVSPNQIYLLSATSKFPPTFMKQAAKRDTNFTCSNFYQKYAYTYLHLLYHSNIFWTLANHSVPGELTKQTLTSIPSIILFVSVH